MTPFNYDLAIFDFDGTLADSLPWFLRSMNAAARRYRFNRVEDHEFDSLRGREPAAIMAHLGMPMWKMPFVVNYVRGAMTRDIDHIQLFEGVPAMLRALAASGIQLALVTTNTESNARRVLGDSAALFRWIGGGAPMFGKAARLRKAMRITGATPKRTICIGDEIRDIEAARAVGAACGVVSWGFADVAILRSREPDQVYATVDDIVAQMVR
jgi:phosphoglycolate phosphatase